MPQRIGVNDDLMNSDGEKLPFIINSFIIKGMYDTWHSPPSERVNMRAGKHHNALSGAQSEEPGDGLSYVRDRIPSGTSSL